MTLEEAIRGALEYEARVRRTYGAAVEASDDPDARKFFALMAEEEEGHLRYLRSRLDEWTRTGAVKAERLETAVPSAKRIAGAARGLASRLDRPDRSGDIGRLKGALDLEDETSAFYRRVVSELPPTDRPLFARFLEIEDGHRAIVQAEIESLTGTGSWFDVREFDLEAG